MSTMQSLPVIEQEISDASSKLGRWMVVIFNNDYCSQVEVVDVLMRATECDMQEAIIEMWEAHTFGKASVHFSTKQECQAAAEIINTIGVKTEVCPEWND